MLIAASTSTRHLYLLWASSIQYIPSYPTYWRPILILFPFKPRTTQWTLSLRFPHQNPVQATPFHHTRYMTRPFHSSGFYNRTILAKENRSLSSSLCSLLHSPVAASPPGSSTLLHTLFQTPSAYVPPTTVLCVPFKNCCVIKKSNVTSTWKSVEKCKAIKMCGDLQRVLNGLWVLKGQMFNIVYCSLYSESTCTQQCVQLCTEQQVW
jgi:hypothetical protein